MPSFRNSRFWLACFLVWFAVLVALSSFSGPQIGPPPFAHFDKLAHFGYFFGGGGLLSAFLYFRKTTGVSWLGIIVTVVIVCSLIGVLDEWRQTFTPGRSGNDFYDWLADSLGGLAGAWVFKLVHPRIK